MSEVESSTVNTVKVCIIVFVVAVLGVLSPGLYADWAFLRAARNQVEPQLQQQLKQAQAEIQRLQKLVPPQATTPEQVK